MLCCLKLEWLYRQTTTKVALIVVLIAPRNKYKSLQKCLVLIHLTLYFYYN